MFPPDDSQGLYNKPAVPNAIAWSEDNLLAVASGPAAVILNPSNLSGPRAYTATGLSDSELLDVAGVPQDAEENIHCHILHMRKPGFNNKLQSTAAVKSLAWSPAGCSSTGGCLLATVTDDHRVRVFARSDDYGSEWTPITDLSEAVKDYLISVEWQEKGVALSASNNTSMRLRGGGGDPAHKQQQMSSEGVFTIGAAVEVFNDEDGLRGSWLSGKIVEPKRHFALVMYDLLREEEDQSKPLCEWFPLHPVDSLDHLDVPQGHTCHAEAGYRMRPAPSSKDVQMEGKPRVGDMVDVRKEGGWWEATVTAIRPEQQELHARMCHSRQKPLKCGWADVRPTLVWTGIAFQRAGKPAEEAAGQEPATSSRNRPRLALPDAGEDDNDSALLKADLSTEQTARDSVPRSFARRFFQLRSQIPDRRLPKYAGADADLALADKGLMKRVLEELQDMHGPQLAKFHLLEKWLLLQAHTRICEGWDKKRDPVAVYAKHAANSKQGIHGDGIDAVSQAAEQPRQRAKARDRKASAAAPSGLTEVDPFGLTTLAAASAAVEQRSKAVKKLPAKPTRAQPARPQQTSRSSAAARRSKGASKEQSSVMQPLCSTQDEGGDGQPVGQKKRGREPDEQDARPMGNKARKGGHGSAPRAAGKVEAEVAQEDLSSRRKPPKDATANGNAGVNEDETKAADEDVAKEATTGRKRPRKPARKPAAAQPQRSDDEAHLSKRRKRSDSGGRVYEDPEANGHAESPDATTEDDDFHPDAQVQSQSHDSSDENGSSSNASLQKWSSGRPRGRRKAKEAVAPATRGRGGRRGRGRGTGPAAVRSRKSNAACKESPYIPPEYQVPGDFDKALLLPLNYEDKYTFNKTLEEAFVERWLVLRLQVPEEDIPTYSKGGHLRGPDVRLYEQVRAEITHQHGEQLNKLGLTQKWLNTEMKRMIRQHVIKPSVKNLANLQLEGTEGTPRLTETEEALKRFRKRREKMLEPSDVEEEEEEVVVDKVPKRRLLLPRTGRRRSKAGEAHGDPNSRIDTALYERRLATLSFTNAVWSPMVRPCAGGSPFTILAAGTRAGRVWLWRYTPPVPLLVGGSTAEREGFALVGSCQAHSSWVTALQWAPETVDGHLLLCSGGSDGSLRLHCAATSALAAATSPPSSANGGLLDMLGALCQPDQRSIVCLDFLVKGSAAAGDIRLSIAAGKQSGSLLAWNSPSLLNLSNQQIAKAAVARGRFAQEAKAHGTIAPTSVRWLDPIMLLSTGIDGRTRRWQVAHDQLTPLADVDVTTELAPDLGGRPLRTATYGATLSGNGLIAAVAMETANATRDHLQESMTYKKMMKGSLQLVPLALPTSPAALEANLRAAVSRLLEPVRPSPAALWDIAAMLHHLAESARKAALLDEDEVEVGEVGEDGGEGAQEEEEVAACKSLLTQEMLDQLEGRFVQLTSAPTAKKKAAASLDLFAGMDASAWQGLQAATVIRRLLHPQRLAQAVNSILANRGEDVQPSELMRRWDAAIRRNELGLLQRHLHDSLTSGMGTDPECRLSRLLVCDWLTLNARHPMLRPELLALREDGYATCEQACPPDPCDMPLDAARELPAREQCPWTDTPLGLSRNVHPLTSALTADIAAEDGKQTFPRCAATLVLCSAVNTWACALCKRRYKHGNRGGDGCCVFCGTHLGHLPSVTSLKIPGWP